MIAYLLLTSFVFPFVIFSVLTLLFTVLFHSEKLAVTLLIVCLSIAPFQVGLILICIFSRFVLGSVSWPILMLSFASEFAIILPVFTLRLVPFFSAIEFFAFIGSHQASSAQPVSPSVLPIAFSLLLFIAQESSLKLEFAHQPNFIML